MDFAENITPELCGIVEGSKASVLYFRDEDGYLYELHVEDPAQYRRLVNQAREAGCRVLVRGTDLFAWARELRSVVK